MKNNKLLIYFILLISIFTVSGCTKKNETTKKEEEMIIVDVRTKEEYEESHVVGAINIPYDTIDKNTKLDKTKLIAVYCKSGKRSSIAYQTLKELGYKVKDLGAYVNITLPKE